MIKSHIKQIEPDLKDRPLNRPQSSDERSDDKKLEDEKLRVEHTGFQTVYIHWRV